MNAALRTRFTRLARKKNQSLIISLYSIVRQAAISQASYPSMSVTPAPMAAEASGWTWKILTEQDQTSVQVFLPAGQASK